MNDQPKWSVSKVERNWEFAADQLNVNLVTIGNVLRAHEGRIAALEAEVEKLRAANGVGDDEADSG